MQKKGHTLEFLRSIAHLRPRSNLFGAVFRVRSRLAFAIHRFFQERGFRLRPHADHHGERLRGRGRDVPRHHAGWAIRSRGKRRGLLRQAAYLTVSGQLEARPSPARCRTSTPSAPPSAPKTRTPRATPRVLDDRAGDGLLRPGRRHGPGRGADPRLVATRSNIAPRTWRFSPSSWTRAAASGSSSSASGPSCAGSATRRRWRSCSPPGKFEYPVEYGLNLQSEHERYLTEEHFKKPGHGLQLPAEIKPFYMRLNDDEATVTAMDRAGARHRRDRRRQPARGAARPPARELESHGLTRDDYGGMSTCAATARCRTPASAWASSACSCSSPACQHPRRDPLRPHPRQLRVLSPALNHSPDQPKLPRMSRNHRITILAGDGIGPEVMAEAIRILEAAEAKFGFSVSRTEHLVGGAAIDATGHPLPPETVPHRNKPMPFCSAPSAARSGKTCRPTSNRNAERCCRCANTSGSSPTSAPASACPPSPMPRR
jgi:hypothetical protein